MEKTLLARILVVVFVMISPFIMLLLYGPETSLSQYWNTPMQPLFVLANAMTSYYFFLSPKWYIPGAMLLLLTAFSVQYYPEVHNILAFIFFITAAMAMYRAKHMIWYFYLFVLGSLVTIYSLFIGEIIAIEILCVYNLHLLLYKQNLINHRHDL